MAGCRVDLTNAFRISNPVSAVIFEPLFAQTVDSLMDASSRGRAVLTHELCAREALRRCVCDDRNSSTCGTWS